MTPYWSDTGQHLTCPSCGSPSPDSPDLFWLLETWGSTHPCVRSAAA